VNVGFVAPRLERLAEHAGSFLCVFAFSERRPFAGITGVVDWRLHGHLSRLRIRGFLGGKAGEALLVPLGDRLSSIAHLVVVGLGQREALDAVRCRGALGRMFDAADGLGDAPLVLALPGRPERVADPAEVMELFLEVYDERGRGRRATVVEPSAEQKAMLQVLERHRLKQWVPAMKTE
jgi:hypothetical protein